MGTSSAKPRSQACWSPMSRDAFTAGALIASLPLVSVLGMMWLWHDRPDAANMAAHTEATFWFLLPSLPMFQAIPWMLRSGVNFWTALAIGCAITVTLYLLMTVLGPKFGLRL